MYLVDGLAVDAHGGASQQPHTAQTSAWRELVDSLRLLGSQSASDEFVMRNRQYDVVTALAGTFRSVPEQLGEMLENGRRAWINDSYWLVMPYKLRDPGVTLELLEPQLGDANPLVLETQRDYDLVERALRLRGSEETGL